MSRMLVVREAAMTVPHPDEQARLASERPEPKFKKGQIVVMKSLKKQLPFRILDVVWEDGWFYLWNKKNAAAEHMIRELTPEEHGG